MKKSICSSYKKEKVQVELISLNGVIKISGMIIARHLAGRRWILSCLIKYNCCISSVLTHYCAMDGKGSIAKLSDSIAVQSANSFSAPLNNWRRVSCDFTIENGIATQGFNPTGMIISHEYRRF